eukprot:gene3382-2336_t
MDITDLICGLCDDSRWGSVIALVSDIITCLIVWASDVYGILILVGVCKMLFALVMNDYYVWCRLMFSELFSFDYFLFRIVRLVVMCYLIDCQLLICAGFGNDNCVPRVLPPVVVLVVIIGYLFVMCEHFEQCCYLEDLGVYFDMGFIVVVLYAILQFVLIRHVYFVVWCMRDADLLNPVGYYSDEALQHCHFDLDLDAVCFYLNAMRICCNAVVYFISFMFGWVSSTYVLSLVVNCLYEFFHIAVIW